MCVYLLIRVHVHVHVFKRKKCCSYVCSECNEASGERKFYKKELMTTSYLYLAIGYHLDEIISFISCVNDIPLIMYYSLLLLLVLGIK